MSVEDAMLPADLRELYDIEDRVFAEEFLHGRRSWPFAGVLPVKRTDGDGGIECGYVRRPSPLSPADPVVHTDACPVFRRRYVDIAQMLAAGWRID